MDALFGLSRQDTCVPSIKNMSWQIALTMVLTAVITGLVVLGALQRINRETPGDSSVDAGFARDMGRHHAQAVEMASIVYRRTDDPSVRLLAYDILTTQQAQIGMMRGWLQGWKLPGTGQDVPMTWMGHAVGSTMPGLASPEAIASLETLPLDEMDRTFLTLMIKHHEGGLVMAQAASERATVDYVRAIAGSMATSQAGEVATMRAMLAERT